MSGSQTAQPSATLASSSPARTLPPAAAGASAASAPASRAAAVFSRMSEAQRVGQLFLASRIMRGLLRQELHFRGVIVSDDLGAAAAVAGLSPATRGIDFLTAGGDLITSQSLPAAVAMDQAILARAAGDAAFRATVNSAAMRILDAKQAYHLMPCR